MSKLENSDLLETRNRLMNEIALLSDEEFNKRYDNNQWSVAQVCHHLVLTEKSFTKAIAYGLKKIDSNKADRKNISLIMDRTRKIEAPDIVKPNSKPMNIQLIIDLFKDSRKNLLDILCTVKDKSILAERAVKHPAFGELPLIQWIELLYLHEQRHIEQIKDIKSHIGVM